MFDLCTNVNAKTKIFSASMEWHWDRGGLDNDHMVRFRAASQAANLRFSRYIRGLRDHLSLQTKLYNTLKPNGDLKFPRYT